MTEQEQQEEEEEYRFLGVRIQIISMPKDDCGYKCQVSPVNSHSTQIFNR